MVLKIDTEGYATSDLYFASFLKASDCLMTGTRKEKGRIFFVFEKTEFIEQLKMDYFNRVAKVSALAYADAIRSLKSLCHM